jgi:hypothetical protein
MQESSGRNSILPVHRRQLDSGSRAARITAGPLVLHGCFRAALVCAAGSAVLGPSAALAHRAPGESAANTRLEWGIAMIRNEAPPRIRTGMGCSVLLRSMEIALSCWGTPGCVRRETGGQCGTLGACLLQLRGGGVEGVTGSDEHFTYQDQLVFHSELGSELNTLALGLIVDGAGVAQTLNHFAGYNARRKELKKELAHMRTEVETLRDAADEVCSLSHAVFADGCFAWEDAVPLCAAAGLTADCSGGARGTIMRPGGEHAREY